jgi:phosphate transport system substrate-binding protein
MFAFLSALVLIFSVQTTAFAANKDIQGKIAIDGSSTVFPITEAVAEEFRTEYPNIRVNIAVSGTGGGFKKFVLGEVQINNASRAIKEQEIKLAKEHNINYLEIPVAFDGITIVINKKNTWATQMTVEELRKMWSKSANVKNWSDVRAGWPARPIKLFGPGTDSGTFDYFVEALFEDKKDIRPDFQKSEDDNILVNGVVGDTDALGFFGYAYFSENKAKLNAVSLDSGKGAVAPSVVTINDGSYKPLSRKVFIYVNKATLKQEEMSAFLNFYLKNVPALSQEVGYIPLSDKEYQLGIKSLTAF